MQNEEILKNYKMCQSTNKSEKCLGVSTKDNFRGRQCYECHRKKYNEYYRLHYAKNKEKITEAKEKTREVLRAAKEQVQSEMIAKAVSEGVERALASLQNKKTEK